nr:hypothetical protein [Tanacetum cinerariifolium]
MISKNRLQDGHGKLSAISQPYCSNNLLGIERKKLLTITSKPVVKLIYKNNKEENRVMIFKEIPKLCDKTLKSVLDMVKKINIDVKHGYANQSLSDADA